MSGQYEERWKLIQQLALLAYVHRGEESKDLYKAVIGAKVLSGFWRECSQRDEIKTYRTQAILAIADFVKAHSHATEKEIQDEVEKQISIFIENIQ